VNIVRWVVAFGLSLAMTGRLHAAIDPASSEWLYQRAQDHLSGGQQLKAVDALHQLLVMDPDHSRAQEALLILEEQRQQRQRALAMEEAVLQAGGEAPPPEPSSSASAGEGGVPSEAASTRQGGLVRQLNTPLAPLVVSGEVRSTVGITRDDVNLQEANGDLSERNFRIFSGPFRYNTFDPRIFSRLRVNLDTPEEVPWQLHSNITVDPWSFVGKTDRITVVGNTPSDSVELELKWWSATNTAINETFLTLNDGTSLATPEIETNEGRTVPTNVKAIFGNVFQIPSMEIDYTFQPIRWLWTGYRNETVDFRVFPLGLEDQAITSDDPLQLSNHHIYWEPSRWLDEWRPGRFNVGATPDDFTRGEWSDDLAFFTRDSDLARLTALRGTSIRWQPAEATSVQAALASPKGLWQEYERFNSFVGMVRVKQGWVDDRFSLGGLYTTRWGYANRRKDATNRVYAVDAHLKPSEWLAWDGEGAVSKSIQDRSSDFESDSRGWAWHNAVTARWWDGRLLMSRLWFTHMDDGFDPGAANYRHTRKDQFWGRHLRLKRRLRLLDAVTPPSPFSPEELEAIRIGDGIDVGRDVLGWRTTGSWFDHRLEPLIDVRNVHRTNGKYLETVVRQENTVKLAEWLTTKTLFIYHDLPHTIGGVDPFKVNADTDRPFNNAAVSDDRDPSLTTYSLGAEFAPMEQVALWGIWERTNDTTVATDDFPRGLLNETSFATFTDGDQVIRFKDPFLYSQGFFPQPPYPFFDIVRAGAYYAPWERLELAVDWTRNEFEHAGQIDDNLNHVGFTTAWSPFKRLVVVGRYVMSWAIDITRENAGEGTEFAGHHSLYGRLTWKATDDAELHVEFGEAALGPVPAVFSVDPLGDFYPTLDTEHLVRIVYSAKF